MSTLWLISYVILWLLVISAGFVILALVREVEALHMRLDSLQKHLLKMSFGADGKIKQIAGERVKA